MYLCLPFSEPHHCTKHTKPAQIATKRDMNVTFVGVTFAEWFLHDALSPLASGSTQNVVLKLCVTLVFARKRFQ